MRKFLGLSLAFILLTTGVFAKEVKVSDAEKVAKNYLSATTSAKSMQPEQVRFAETITVKRDNNPVYYAFNLEEDGFIIVSAEDGFTPVIGYSDKGQYNAEEAPSNFQWLMNEYADMITFVRENQQEASAQERALWSRLLSDEFVAEKTSRAEVIGPLCDISMWNQESPYNYYTPTHSQGQTMAGCVATAMSMIMNYWRWPLQGQGAHSYRPKSSDCDETFGLLSVNFEEASYDYDGMLAVPGKTFCDPIALLMYHCGVSVDMMYCVATGQYGGSGAYSRDVPAAIKNYFKYSPDAKHVTRYGHSEANWIKLIKEQLEQGYPVYYSGTDPAPNGGGHAFVCDGYDAENDTYHFNFGWSGSNNGWFTNCIPAQFSSGQAAVVNFIPDRSKGYPYAPPKNKLLPYKHGSITDCSGPADNYAAGTTASWLINPMAGGDSVVNLIISCEQFDLAEGDYVTIYDGEDESATRLGGFTGSELFSPVTSTGNKVYITFTSQAGSSTGKGFLLTYKANEEPVYCSGQTTFNTLEGTFSDGSEQGVHYNSGTVCKWDINLTKLPGEYEIELSFNYLDVELGSYIRIYDVTTSKMLEEITRVRDRKDYPSIKVASKRVRVQFNSGTYTNADGFEISYKATRTDIPVDIDELEGVNALKVYPNPANDQFTISFNSMQNEDFGIALYSITGQKVYAEDLSQFVGAYSRDINTTQFAKGVYVLRINSSKGTTTHKLVIQ